jgi:hypothetical protein
LILVALLGTLGILELIFELSNGAQAFQPHHLQLGLMLLGLSQFYMHLLDLLLQVFINLVQLIDMLALSFNNLLVFHYFYLDTVFKLYLVIV